MSGSFPAAQTCRYIHTPSAFARQHLLYIQEAGRLKSRDRHISRRSHLDSYLFFIVLSGKGTVTIRENRWTLGPGDHVFLDCRTPYSHESSEEEPWELLWVHFHGNAMDGYASYFVGHQLPPVFHPDAPSPFQSLLEQILTLEQARAGSRELLENELLHRLATGLLTYQGSAPSREDSLTAKLQEIRLYLDEHYASRLSLDELAGQFYISKYHMSREFKKAFGITVGGYVTSQRITKAKEMLRFTDLQIEAIARSCGIDDNSYFNKVFQKAEGITAREYRRKWRGQ
ncbi:MAG: AraC family transcriptional regulator [Eubacteriales bacterium]|nr:AraC family transcriptional regulator [Eubacteriales bacterium]